MSIVQSYMIDPSEFFMGAQPRPKLEIISPENGQVLDSGQVEISIKITGYNLPSKFHSSNICVGLSTGISFVEQCFDQTTDLIFHASGLTPGLHYSVRVVFYERGNAIAVSVRNFRVAGIKGLLTNGGDETVTVTIQAAMQVAINFQIKGMEEQAEVIYRSILSEFPSHPETLHLLGVVFYQKGDPKAAIPYIEQALKNSYKAFEGLHNTLGECYRQIGRLDEAQHHFRLELALNPFYSLSTYNLAITYQQTFEWDKAIELYNSLTKLDNKANPIVPLSTSNNAETRDQMNQQRMVVSEEIRFESKIRECDLLQAQGRLEDAIECWHEALVDYKDTDMIWNELGIVYAKVSEYEAAMECFQKGISLNNFLSELNAAYVYEMQGYMEESIRGYTLAQQHAVERGLPTYHVILRQATILPRILPSSQERLLEIRKNFENNLNYLMHVSASEHFTVDNAQPLSFGYSLGYHLAFHNMNNVKLKVKLYAVYANLCPALLQGSNFLDKTGTFPSMKMMFDGLAAPDPDDSREHSNGKLSEENSAGIISSTELRGSGNTDKTEHSENIPSSEEHSENITSSEVSTVEEHYKNIPSSEVYSENITSYEEHSENILSSNGGSSDAVEELDNDPISILSSASILPSKSIKVGFVSRFFYTHEVGILSLGMIKLLYEAGYHITVFFLHPQGPLPGPSQGQGQQEREDIVTAQIAAACDAMRYLPLNIELSADKIRKEHLDVLIYPELGKDPVSYFLAFSRLAPVQAAWLLHPETSGIDNIDYFLSSTVDSHKDANTFYSEKLVKLRNFGARFTDFYENITFSISRSPRDVLLERAKLTGLLKIPKAAHIYVISQELYKIHPMFDDVIVKLLLRDRLAYVVICDVSIARITWQELFTSRVLGLYGPDIKSRLIFYYPGSLEGVLRTVAAGHVLLDTFPVSSLLSCLQGLGMGVPVMTFPYATERLGGRFCLGLLNQMKIGDQDNALGLPEDRYRNVFTVETEIRGAEHSENVPSGGLGFDMAGKNVRLVANSIPDYITMAMAIAHKPMLRENITVELLRRRHFLFKSEVAWRRGNKGDGEEVAEYDDALMDWVFFLSDSVLAARRKQKKEIIL